MYSLSLNAREFASVATFMALFGKVSEVAPNVIL
ncbi:hypothetical protein Y017_15125 [Alcanivorax sp. 97CO-5]|nr:hypothetical protein Y017_15125 [Alcanivorax sp. 97CO-5]